MYTSKGLAIADYNNITHAYTVTCSFCGLSAGLRLGCLEVNGIVEWLTNDPVPHLGIITPA